MFNSSPTKDNLFVLILCANSGMNSPIALLYSLSASSNCPGEKYSPQKASTFYIIIALAILAESANQLKAIVA
jgi:hypothetical protein